MAIRRYTLAADNTPEFGYFETDEMAGSGEYFYETSFTPQGVMLAFAQQVGVIYTDPQPYVRLRYTDPFEPYTDGYGDDHQGFWIEYGNLPDPAITVMINYWAI